MMSNRLSRQLLFHLTWVGVFCCCFSAVAQNKDEGPLYTQQPYDRVTMKSGESMDVKPLRFPWGNRQIPPTLPAAGNLVARRMASKSIAEVNIPWTQISRIDLFEDMIMQEALKLTKEGKFDNAFPYFSYLLKLKEADQPRGLDKAISTYLRSDAEASFRAGDNDRALAILGSLYERTPKAPRLVVAVDTVAGRIINKHYQEQNYRAARMTLDVVDETFKGLKLTVLDKWRTKFQQAAASQLKEAERLANARQFMAARQSINEAVGVWPELPGVIELQARLQREHPIISIGVLEASPKQPVHRLDYLASSRAATLMEPKLVQLVGAEESGTVEYRSSVGQIVVAPSGKQVSIELDSGSSRDPLSTGLAASALARQLIATTKSTSPTFNETLSKELTEVSIEYPGTVSISLDHTHVRPEALLSLPMNPTVARLSDRGVFTIAERTDKRIRFVADSEYRGAIAEIHEVPFEDDEQLVTALAQGSVDVIDRVPPWQIARLESLDKVVVEQYRLPTIHVMIPTGRSPLVEQREFRRALCYGIDRVKLIRQVLLAGNDIPGFQPVSGPFPAGVSLDDPIRYAYNSQVKPRVYDPYMSIVLSSAAWSNVQKSQGIKEPDPDTPLPTLKLGHSADSVARTACIEIAKYLKPLGITLELVELNSEQILSPADHVDLRYAELATWEPVVDARRLLGARGLAGESSDFMMLSLDRLDACSNWNDVTSRLYSIHDIASTDLPVIPLWQSVNHFAYRRALTGVSPQPVTLFQDIADWQLDIRPSRL